MNTTYSWLDCKTGEPILVNKERTSYFLIPQKFGGGKLQNDCYQGDNLFNKKNIYSLIAQWNAPEKCSNNEIANIVRGVNMASTDERNFILKYPIKITYDKDATYESCAPSLKDPFYGMQEMPENIRQVYQDFILRLDLDQKDVPYVTLSNEFGGIATSYDEVTSITLAINDEKAETVEIESQKEELFYMEG